MKVTCKALTKELGRAVAEIKELKNFSIADDGIILESLPSVGPLKVECDGKTAKIYHKETCDFFKGLYMLAAEDGKAFTAEAESRFDELTVMLDCSRNKVIKLSEAKRLFRILVLMGYTGIQMYMEDTYVLEDYPYFGYMRGKYSLEELREMDEYGKLFGFEVIPSIQTLGHLETVLRWDAHEKLRDTRDVLLAEEEETYKFIEAMIKTLSENLSSRKINLGMDEAEGIGTGEYKKRHGEVAQNAILLKHVDKVIEICKKYGYEPMMWADMIYHTAGIWVAKDAEGKDGIKMPEGVKFDETIVPILWDYYNDDGAEYTGMMKILQKLSKKAAFAGGAWKWSGTVPKNAHSLHVTKISLDSAEEAGMKNIINTIWGDDSDEGSVYTVLPSIAYYGARRYGSEDIDTILKTICSASQADFATLDEAVHVGGNPAPGKHWYQPWRYMLYGDPMCSQFDKHINKGYGAEFAAIAKKVEKAAENAGSFKYIFDTIASLNRLLSYKAELGILLKEAYDAGDKKKLAELIESHVKPAMKEAAVYHQLMCAQWFKEAMGIGLEAVDIRLAAVETRLNTTLRRVSAYVAGEVDCLEELMETRRFLDLTCKDDGTDHPLNLRYCPSWKPMCTAGTMW